MIRAAPLLSIAAIMLGIGGCAMKSSQPSSDQVESALPNPYQPDRSNEPHARKAWEDGTQALEAECLRSGQYCREASESRKALSKRRR